MSGGKKIKASTQKKNGKYSKQVERTRKNMIKKLEKHLKNFPNDVIAKEKLERYK